MQRRTRWQIVLVAVGGIAVSLGLLTIWNWRARFDPSSEQRGSGIWAPTVPSAEEMYSQLPEPSKQIIDRTPPGDHRDFVVYNLWKVQFPYEHPSECEPFVRQVKACRATATEEELWDNEIGLEGGRAGLSFMELTRAWVQLPELRERSDLVAEAVRLARHPELSDSVATFLSAVEKYPGSQGLGEAGLAALIELRSNPRVADTSARHLEMFVRESGK